MEIDGRFPNHEANPLIEENRQDITARVVADKADIGIAVSVAPGAGNALIANNVIADVLRGAVIGTDRRRIVTGDLTKGGAERYAHLSLAGNRAR